jgi:uncharacterized membrane protein YidH (DUF202 family)
MDFDKKTRKQRMTKKCYKKCSSIEAYTAFGMLIIAGAIFVAIMVLF